ncbi:MAG TPA: DUF3467 domain-containing protein [Gemmataceae bacterium]|nr:DUF3467 domain-containing protein [Gemmataceae bacterium]
MAEAERKAAPPQEAPLDTSHMQTTYTNWYRVTGTAEEFILEFGLSPSLGMTADPIRVSDRLVMSFYTAKRLLAHLTYALQQHERAFGALEIDVMRRLQQAQQLRQLQGFVPPPSS